MSRTRDRRRALKREALADLRASGCTCSPTMSVAHREHCAEVGAQDGIYVRHQRGCPFGDAVYRLNVLGIVPQAWSYGRRCER